MLVNRLGTGVGRLPPGPSFRTLFQLDCRRRRGHLLTARSH